MSGPGRLRLLALALAALVALGAAGQSSAQGRGPGATGAACTWEEILTNRQVRYWWCSSRDDLEALRTGTLADGDLGWAAGNLYFNDGAAWVVAADDVTVKRVAADVATTTASFSDVTGLSYAVAANTSYSFACDLSYTTAVSTTALQLSVNGPASPTVLRYTVLTATSATTTFAASESAYDTNTNPATGGGATALPVTVVGSIENGTTAGTLVIRLRTEVGGSTVTVLRGSFCTFYGR